MNDDNFTFVSVRGKAVVDYVVMPHTCLESCTDFKVITASDLLHQNAGECFLLIGDRCCLPDHSLLVLTFKVGSQITQEKEFICDPKKKTEATP